MAGSTRMVRRRGSCRTLAVRTVLAGLRTVLPCVRSSHGVIAVTRLTGAVYVDSANDKVESFAYDLSTGTLSERRDVALPPAQPGSDSAPAEGVFDGLCMDGQGNIWVARWSDSRVVGYKPSGEIICHIKVPGCKSPTIPCFGGKSDIGYVHPVLTTQDPSSRRCTSPRHTPSWQARATSRRSSLTRAVCSRWTLARVPRSGSSLDRTGLAPRATALLLERFVTSILVHAASQRAIRYGACRQDSTQARPGCVPVVQYFCDREKASIVLVGFHHGHRRVPLVSKRINRTEHSARRPVRRAAQSGEPVSLTSTSLGQLRKG